MGRFNCFNWIAKKSGQTDLWPLKTAPVLGLGLLASLCLAPAAQAIVPTTVSALGQTTSPTISQTAHQTTFLGQASYTLSQSLSWGGIIDWLSRRKVAGASRGQYCPIAPSYNEPVWSLQPSVFWQGSLGAIGLRRAGEDQAMWKQATSNQSSGLNRIRYSGRMLQPGQDYEWLFFTSETAPEPERVIRFRVMAAADRAQVRSALLKLGGTGEARAQARAIYLSQQELSADTLAEMVSVSQPSPELEQLLSKIAKQACQ
jgi:hypothetical protein